MDTGDPAAADELRMLIEGFAQVLAQLGHAEVADSLPWLDVPGGHPEPAQDGHPQPLDDLEVRARSVAFRLLNLAEERAAARARRSGDPEALRGTWLHVLGQLRESGAEARRVGEALRSVHVEPVCWRPTVSSTSSARPPPSR